MSVITTIKIENNVCQFLQKVFFLNKKSGNFFLLQISITYIKTVWKIDISSSDNFFIYFLGFQMQWYSIVAISFMNLITFWPDFLKRCRPAVIFLTIIKMCRNQLAMLGGPSNSVIFSWIQIMLEMLQITKSEKVADLNFPPNSFPLLSRKFDHIY